MLEAYIRLSDELEEKEWRFTIIRKMGQMRVYIVMKSGKYFQIAPKIHFDRLKLEGCHTSLLSKIKDVQNPMLLIVGKHDVVTCEKQIEIFNKDARNGKYIVFEESGHSPHYEEADRFAETVIHF